MSKKRSIGKLAKEVGVSVETVRYYERQGLIDKPQRSEGPRVQTHLAVAQKGAFRLTIASLWLKAKIGSDDAQEHLFRRPAGEHRRL